MENREETIKNKTRFSPIEDQIDTEIDQAIANQDLKALRSLSSEMTQKALKKMRTYHRK